MSEWLFATVLCDDFKDDELLVKVAPEFPPASAEVLAYTKNGEQLPLQARTSITLK